MKKILEMNHVQKSFNDNTLHVLNARSIACKGKILSLCDKDAGCGLKSVTKSSQAC